MIAVIDYGMGNMGAIINMLRKLGAEAMATSEPEVVRRAEKLILPGVGAFDMGIKNLLALGLTDVLREEVVEKGKLVLGICLGMQLFTRRSEEGELPGLGWVDAETVRFRFGEEHRKLKIPHMGWNVVTVKKQSPLFPRGGDEMRFYFVHSYHVVCGSSSDVLAVTHYGDEFVAALLHRNIIGVQFHPEKSHHFGLEFLKQFLELPPLC